MKILYHHRIASQDGQQVHLVEIVREMKVQGHDVLVVGPSIHKKSTFGSDGGWVSKLKSKLPQWIYESLEFSYSILATLRLGWMTYKYRPDFIYERYNAFLPSGVIVSKSFGIPLLLEVNAPVVEERVRFFGMSMPFFAKHIENWTWRNASKVLPVTAVLSTHLTSVGVDVDNITVIHNGIREETFKELSVLPPSFDKDKGVIIGFVGFMHLTCGVEYAIQALALLPSNVRLVCIGDGDILPSLKQIARDFNVVDRVEFMGLLPREQVFEYLKTFDIAIQPDVTPYASPLKIFEYMSCGSIIVCPDSDNIREILDFDTSMFFKSGDVEHFKEVLSRVALSIMSLDSMRLRTRSQILRKGFFWSDNVRRIISIAEDEIQKKLNNDLDTKRGH